MLRKNIQNIKISKLLIFLFLVQVSLLVTLIVDLMVKLDREGLFHETHDYFTITICIILVINFIFLFLKLRIYVKEEVKLKIQQEMIENMNQLNIRIREQRHDFLNHIQVIYSLLEMEEYKEARDYLNKTYDDIDKLSKFLRTKDHAINALLQAKYHDAKRNNIDCSITISSRLDKLKIPSWEMCRILSNLIDNAIDATKQLERERKICIQIKETLTEYVFEIQNKTLPMEKETLDRLFDINFSTKQGDEHGLGLYIVRQTVDEFEGKLIVTTLSNYICFTLFFPKQ